MAQLEDKINTTLDQVISSDWIGKGRGAGGDGSRKKKGGGRGSSKGQGRRLVRRRVKGGGKGGNATGRKGGDALGARRRGLVKKTLFSKRRRGSPALARADRGWSKGKGKGKGTLRRRRLSKGKGKGKGGGNWSSDDGGGYGQSVRRLRRGPRGKGGGKGWGKSKGMARGYRIWGGKGKGKNRPRGKGKGKGQASDGYGIRRRIAKRQPGSRLNRDSGKAKGKGMARAFAMATGGGLGRRTSWGKGGGRSEHDDRGDREPMGRISADDQRMMKKITIVAQLDKVPKPSPAMQGFSMGGRGRSSAREGSLSRRFGANRDR